MNKISSKPPEVSSFATFASEPPFGPVSNYYQPEESIRGLSCLLPLPTKLVKKPLSRGQSAGNPLLNKNKEWMWGSSETGCRNLSSTSVNSSPK